MKKYAVKFLCIIVFLSIWGSFKTLQAQSDYSVPLTFSVSTTGINRFISSQWANGQTSWSGTYQGLNYSFTLEKPTVSLSNSTIKIMLSLSISSPVYNGKVTLTPSLTIPSTTIDASQIISKYINLHDQIIGTAQLIDSRLQHVIEEALAPIDWIMYKGKIIDNSTVRLSESSDISYKGIPALTFSVTDNELNILIASTITANIPSYSFQWMRADNRTFGFRILSNDKFTIVARDKIYDGFGVDCYFSNISPVPVEATYNPSLNKYAAEFIAKSANGLMNNLRIVTKVYLQRGGMESIWSIIINVPVGQTDWVSDEARISAVRGE